MSPIPTITENREKVLQKAQQFMSEVSNPLIVILGPTASGKTDLSLECAEISTSQQSRGVEMINADSRQFYRGLDIGTAKLEPHLRSATPHHLIDFLDPRESFSIAQYQERAQECIQGIRRRACIPIMVGGSMLYISSIIDGLTPAPPTDVQRRSRMMEEYALDDGRTLHARLRELDPESATKIHRNNMPQLIRSLEICLLTGGTKSEYFNAQNVEQQLDFNLFVIGISWPMLDLYERISQRTEKMFADGWIEEVQSLLDRGVTPDAPGMKSHGYREIAKYLQDQESGSLCDLKEQIKLKGREYARSQVKWWKQDERIQWIYSSC